MYGEERRPKERVTEREAVHARSPVGHESSASGKRDMSGSSLRPLPVPVTNNLEVWVGLA